MYELTFSTPGDGNDWPDVLVLVDEVQVTYGEVRDGDGVHIAQMSASGTWLLPDDEREYSDMWIEHLTGETALTIPERYGGIGTTSWDQREAVR
jgi:hypothetical protein